MSVYSCRLWYLHLTRSNTDLFCSDRSPSQRTNGQSSSHFAESEVWRFSLSVVSSLPVLSTRRKVTGGFPVSKEQEMVTCWPSLMRWVSLTSCPSIFRLVTLGGSECTYVSKKRTQRSTIYTYYNHTKKTMLKIRRTQGNLIRLSVKYSLRLKHPKYITPILKQLYFLRWHCWWIISFQVVNEIVRFTWY